MVIQTNQLTLYMAKVTVCSEIKTKHKYSVAKMQLLNVKPAGASTN